jgi:hypothetical protein
MRGSLGCLATHGGAREDDSHRSAFTGPAEHEQIPTDCSDKSARLKSADAEATSLCRAERLEQFVADELWGHTMAVIDDIDLYMHGFVANAYLHLFFASFDSVLAQMKDD